MADSLPPSEHRYGRGGFLLLVAGGASSLIWAGPVSSFLSPLTSAGSQLVGNLFPVGGWRIYTISGSMPIFDSSSWRLEIGGLVKRPQSLTYDQLTALPRVDQTSTFHCVTGWTVKNVHWGGVRFQQLSDLVQPLPSATAVRFVSLERPYEDSLTLEQLRLPDAMSDAGSRARRPAALAPPRIAGPRDPAGDVRLQGRQVADEDGVRRQAAARLLGAARLRPERVGGTVEWL
jgi:hypothetical protein